MEEPDISNMDGFFGRQATEADYVRLNATHGSAAGLMGSPGLDEMAADLMGGDSLDDIVMQNQKEMQRQRSLHHPYGNDSSPQHGILRRGAIMNFDSRPSPNLNTYPFDISNMASSTPNLAPGSNDNHARHHGARNGSRRRSIGNLALDTQFASSGNNICNNVPHQAPFHSPLDSAGVDLDDGAAFSATGLSAGVANSMSMGFPPNGMHSVGNRNGGQINPYSQASLSQGFTHHHFSPMQPTYAHNMREPVTEPIAGESTLSNIAHADEPMSNPQTLQLSDQMQHIQADLGAGNLSLQAKSASRQPHHEGRAPEPSNDSQRGVVMQRLSSGAKASFKSPDTASVAPAAQGPDAPDKKSLFQGIYSSSGFDMVKVLTRVAARPNPEINIGAVDMSCAFVVCDVTKHDLPIVYCSDVFERLTGYHRHEILGRNCRFLQAPNGEVQSGIERKYVDDEVVLYLKNKVTDLKEAQTSLINYRKGGQPFMNLLTIIPISWDSDDIRFYVGFQVDLVEAPQSVTNKNPDGSYAMNYQRGGYLPRYVWQTPDQNRNQIESGQTIPRDDVSTVLSTIGSGESELSKRIWDKVLLENTDDVVHVLSLKGLFLYLSPSSRKILEYDSSELVGTALSSVCHPSDIVPVTRELKDTSTGASVNVVFRIRRKNSGYTWFESHGSLHTEQGKGRKCIILVGRERPVYALSKNDIIAAGGMGECELWTKMSTSGMFLFVSSNVKTLLDRQPEELVGTSIQALMRNESRIAFGRVLELARTGKRTQIRHEMQNKRGQVLQALTTIYPGDAEEGNKPTFFVAQSRLLKHVRPSPGINGSSMLSPKSSKGDQAIGNGSGNGNGITPRSSSQELIRTMQGNTNESSDVAFDGIVTRPGGSGLPIGSQDLALASDENVFDELKTTRSTSWQFELRQMEKRNRLLAEELQSLISSRKKRKRRKGAGHLQKDCANCHTRVTPEWRRGPSGNRDLCNSCGLRWAKQNGRASPRTGSQQSDKQSSSPAHSSPVGVEPPANGSQLSAEQQLERKRSDESSSTGLNEAAANQGANSAKHSDTTLKVEEGIIS
ncbi:MAG: hypothetical protein M1825_004914 [Sarcosagium campestre]|nr:MAG: hypothetical protein M1825_004914 [Sarcosagium campestre]